MENIIYISCVILGIIIHIAYDMWIEKREWREISIEIDIDKCCKNAYDMGFHYGHRKAWEEFQKENNLI